MGENNNQPKKFSIKMALATGGTIITFAAAIVGLWTSIDNQIKSAIKTSTMEITNEIQRTTYDVIRLHKQDLELRIRVLKLDIDSTEAAGRPVPERKLIQLETYEDQLKEINEKWKEYQ